MWFTPFICIQPSLAEPWVSSLWSDRILLFLAWTWTLRPARLPASPSPHSCRWRVCVGPNIVKESLEYQAHRPTSGYRKYPWPCLSEAKFPWVRDWIYQKVTGPAKASWHSRAQSPGRQDSGLAAVCKLGFVWYVRVKTGECGPLALLKSLPSLYLNFMSLCFVSN